MELEEAISILEDENQEIFNFTTGVNKKWKEAYEMVIQVAKNSIPKEKVKKIKRYCKTKFTFQTFGNEQLQRVIEMYVNKTKNDILNLLEEDNEK